jgi:hypothetical protein
VVENPIWKTSYRLVLGENGKPYLQGWAVVENPTDEDWAKVTMALVSGRPISFKMDLYDPLYVARPTVEPELFASLRPPTYGGATAKPAAATPSPAPMPAGRPGGGGGPAGGMGFGVPADSPAQFGPSGGRDRGLRREYAEEVAKKLKQDLDLGRSVPSVASASALGDYYQYVIDRPVDLARQKSALLPIVNKDVEGRRVSIYNPAVQPKHPLLGLRFKNTTGMPLSQGPMTVFEGSVYAGDTRVLDLQPDEERLISYALDLGTEVAVKPGKDTSRITSIKAVKGIITTRTVQREERVYDVSNRSGTDRTLLIEHPNRKGDGFVFIGEHKPKEEAADVFRFEVPVGAKKDVSYAVIEERPVESSIQLTNNADEQIQYFLKLKEVPEALKAMLQKALQHKASWDDVRRKIEDANRRVQTITQDQKRLRDNMRELPRDSDLFKRYLRTLEEQEKEMDDLQALLKELHGSEAIAHKAYDDFLANLTVE